MWTSVAALAALMGLAACSDAARLEAGAPCGGDGACASGFCDRVCREASGDDDGDGLDNATERGLGSDPDGLDSDRDGIVDALEATGDADQDGRPDIVESALVDADRDCLPAQLDPDEASPEQDGAVLARALCRRAGVCAEGPGAVTARCETLVVDGAELAQVVCEYDKIAGFEAGVETSCDGRDNDCDGHTDEDLGTIDSTGLVRALGDDCVGTGACASRVGVVECDPGGRAVCSVDAGGSAAPSVTDDVDCDAIDNDCDGQTDEGVAWMDPRSGQLLRFGEPCAGLGACGLAQGVVECAADAARGVCSTEPGGSGDLAAPESCNGLDDDCDGRTDEGLVWIGPDGKPRGIGESCGVGRCRGGQVVCGAGAAVCSTAALAQPELCNGEDDDCDGASDEPEDLTNACPALGLCAKLSLSRVSCDGPSGVVSCTFDPPGQVEAYETRCNGEDDDCDGQTDEDLAPRDGEPLGATCTGRGACADTTGTVVCDAD
ncbi:MAG: MopE-related protein, partial [Myxococcota bacterium]